MLRKHKKFSKPRQAYDSARIEEENQIVSKYGLKNKREIWKAKAKLDIIRKTAKKLANSGQEEQDKFIEKLKKSGFNVGNVIDVLALNEEDILKRRLQTILINRKIATTPKGARQLITHKHIAIGDTIVSIPSYMVSSNEEKDIKILARNKPHKANKQISSETEEARSENE